MRLEAYPATLYRLGATEITAFEKVYPHVLDIADSVVEWMSGTALVPYFDRLPGGLKDPFLSRYSERLKELWPSGSVYYGFKRILFAATKPM